MAISAMVKIPEKKRKAGQRAGLTRAKIAAGALHLCLTPGQKVSVHTVAKHLKVVPTTIRAHFKGGFDEVLDEVAALVLDELAPPFKPNQSAEDYLLQFFRTLLAAGREKPFVIRLMAVRLTDTPLLNPSFAERMCAALGSLSQNQDGARAFRRFVGRLSGLVLVETGAPALLEPKAAASIVASKIAALGEVQFPTLHELAKEFGEDFFKRAETAYLDAEAAFAVHALITELVANDG
jgi:AcrR family transcriptional regulator